jgi:hypothetical protein
LPATGSTRDIRCRFPDVAEAKGGRTIAADAIVIKDVKSRHCVANDCAHWGLLRLRACAARIRAASAVRSAASTLRSATADPAAEVMPTQFERLDDCLRLSDCNEGVNALSTLADAICDGASDHGSNRCLLSTNRSDVRQVVSCRDLPFPAALAAVQC